MTIMSSRMPAFSSALMFALNIGIVVVRNAEKPTTSGLCSLDRLDELLGCDVDAEIVHGEAGALEHDVDEVLADVVDVALDGAHDIGADLLRAGLGEQRAEDVERALHRARGDEHLGNEEVAALEPCAHLLQRRDERVVEHRLGLHVVGETRR